MKYKVLYGQIVTNTSKRWICNWWAPEHKEGSFPECHDWSLVAITDKYKGFLCVVHRYTEMHDINYDRINFGVEKIAKKLHIGDWREGLKDIAS